MKARRRERLWFLIGKAFGSGGYPLWPDAPWAQRLPRRMKRAYKRGHAEGRRRAADI